MRSAAGVHEKGGGGAKGACCQPACGMNECASGVSFVCQVLFVGHTRIRTHSQQSVCSHTLAYCSLAAVAHSLAFFWIGSVGCAAVSNSLTVVH
jgi:hypothetical protein